eukprot:Opistho-1_new@31688
MTIVYWALRHTATALSLHHPALPSTVEASLLLLGGGSGGARGRATLGLREDDPYAYDDGAREEDGERRAERNPVAADDAAERVVGERGGAEHGPPGHDVPGEGVAALGHEAVPAVERLRANVFVHERVLLDVEVAAPLRERLFVRGKRLWVELAHENVDLAGLGLQQRRYVRLLARGKEERHVVHGLEAVAELRKRVREPLGLREEVVLEDGQAVLGRVLDALPVLLLREARALGENDDPVRQRKAAQLAERPLQRLFVGRPVAAEKDVLEEPPAPAEHRKELCARLHHGLCAAEAPELLRNHPAEQPVDVAAVVAQRNGAVAADGALGFLVAVYLDGDARPPLCEPHHLRPVKVPMYSALI